MTVATRTISRLQSGMGLLKLSHNPELQIKAHQEAKAIACALQNITHVIAIYLFGSIAKGSANDESDIDLLLVVSDDIDIKTLQSEVYKKPLSTTFAVDLIIKKLSDFDCRKDVGGVCFEAFNYGEKII